MAYMSVYDFGVYFVWGLAFSNLTVAIVSIVTTTVSVSLR